MLIQSRVDDLNAILGADLCRGNLAEKQPAKWKCKLSEMFIGDYLIIPLTSAKMLKSESYLMNNRCRDLIRQCKEREYSVFSIRSRSGERLATLGLTNDEEYWRIDQCFGPSNTEVLEETRDYLDNDEVLQKEWYATELYYVAHDVLRLMNSSAENH